jgi:hypothetical protein
MKIVHDYSETVIAGKSGICNCCYPFMNVDVNWFVYNSGTCQKLDSERGVRKNACPGSVFHDFAVSDVLCPK